MVPGFGFCSSLLEGTGTGPGRELLPATASSAEDRKLCLSQGVPENQEAGAEVSSQARLCRTMPFAGK